MSAELELLSRIRTLADAVAAFSDDDRCRRLLEAMVWPRGRLCPACGCHRSISLAGRDTGRRARPGLYQCSDQDCRQQFTVTTRTPLHATKLPLRTWLLALWFILQSDKGVSSIRLAEIIGVSQPTAWRMGHVLRLLVARDHTLGGVIEIDEMYFGGAPRSDPDKPRAGRGRKGQPRTTKTPAMVVVQRPAGSEPGTPAGEARACVVADLSLNETERVLEASVTPQAHLMSDEWKAFVAAGTGFARHDTVCHARKEYARGTVHANAAEGFNNRVRQTIAGVFHHISSQHADLYFHEIGFRWSQRIAAGQKIRKARKGRTILQTLWDRVPPARQLPAVFIMAVGRQIRRTKAGGIDVRSTVAVFG